MLMDQGVDEYEPGVITLLSAALQNEGKRVLAETTQLDEPTNQALSRVVAGKEAQRWSFQKSVEFSRLCESINDQPLPKVTGEFDWLFAPRDSATVSAEQARGGIDSALLHTADVGSDASDVDDDFLEQLARDLSREQLPGDPPREQLPGDLPREQLP